MLLKTVHQWDICNQEDLDTFREESEAIHHSAARILYRTDPDADPDQSRREDEEKARSLRNRTRSRRRRPGETDEQWRETNRIWREANQATVPQTDEPEVENTAIDVNLLYPSREAFLERLADDLEGRNRRIKHDGYCIAVKAVVEHRNGSPVRAEFVETEGPRLAHLPDPNGGRILVEWEEESAASGRRADHQPRDRRPGRKYPGRSTRIPPLRRNQITPDPRGPGQEGPVAPEILDGLGKRRGSHV